MGMPGNTQTLKTIQERTAKLSGLFLGAFRVQVPPPRASREASAETNLVRVAALAKQEEGAGDDEYAPVENAAVPLLSHMKSDPPRTCRELGFSLGGSGGSFSALAAAAEAELKRSESCSSMGGWTSTAAVSTEDAMAHANDGAVRPSVSEPSVSRMSSVQSVVSA